MCHYCNVFHWSLFWFLWYQTSPILGCTASTENNIQKIFEPKWTQKYDNVGGIKWSRYGPCPLGARSPDSEPIEILHRFCMAHSPASTRRSMDVRVLCSLDVLIYVLIVCVSNYHPGGSISGNMGRGFGRSPIKHNKQC